MTSKKYKDVYSRHDESVLNQARKNNGLPIIESSMRNCLKCGDEFMSPDKRVVRICNYCKTLMASSDYYKFSDF